jgi:hypothetical protein
MGMRWRVPATFAVESGFEAADCGHELAQAVTIAAITTSEGRCDHRLLRTV